MSQLPPSTTDYVRFHALHHPSSVALINRDQQITYCQFYSDLRKLISTLKRIALPAGSSIAVECDDLYLHWMILLACEATGLVSASFVATERDSSSRALLTYVDLAICEHDLPKPSAKVTLNLAKAWVAEVLAQDEPLEEALAGGTIGLDQPQRIRRSSGSTGTQKMMVAHRGSEEMALQAFAAHMGFSKDTRLLITSSFAVGSMYMRATACLRLGATCIDARLSPAHAIETYKPTHVRLFQYQAALVLSELPPTYQKPRRLTVMLGAGPLSDELRQRIVARLATDIIYTYNTNETLIIAVIDPDGVATLRPGAEAQVVDDDDTPVPPGRTGRICVRTDSQVHGYLNDPDTTARFFKDGWFYTGDIGALVGPRRLRVLGRFDDVLNIGGIKYLPSDIEDEIVRIAPVKEAGVTSILGESGAEELAVALVLNPSAQFDAVLDSLSKRWLPREMRGHIIAVEKLPRTETGKIQRHILKSMFQRLT
jgi:2,3-dihydroxybenzoate-AMP ligase